MNVALIIGSIALCLMLYGLSTDVERAWKRWRQCRQLEALWRQPCAKDRELQR